MTFYEDDDSCLPRLAQLTEKTNQFNVDKKPLTEGDIKGYIESSNHHIFYARLQDKFGDYGVIAFAVTEEKNKKWHISTLLMSCRVFGREVEEAFFGAICGRAEDLGIKEISVAFKESPKNAPAKEFVMKHFGGGDKFIKVKSNIPKWIKINYGKI